MATMTQPVVSHYFYSDANFCELARLLVRVWGARSAIKRATALAAGNIHGMRLAREVDRIVRLLEAKS